MPLVLHPGSTRCRILEAEQAGLVSSVNELVQDGHHVVQHNSERFCLGGAVDECYPWPSVLEPRR